MALQPNLEGVAMTSHAGSLSAAIDPVKLDRLAEVADQGRPAAAGRARIWS